MSQYHHLTILERERIFLLHEKGFSIRKIGNDIQHSSSTISRELRRNKEKNYSPSKAEKNYASRRKKCGRHHILNDPRV